MSDCDDECDCSGCKLFSKVSKLEQINRNNMCCLNTTLASIIMVVKDNKKLTRTLFKIYYLLEKINSEKKVKQFKEALKKYIQKIDNAVVSLQKKSKIYKLLNNEIDYSFNEQQFAKMYIQFMFYITKSLIYTFK